MEDLFAIKKAQCDAALGRIDIEKSEGDRGGKVIGYTKSGKPVYVDKRASAYKDFSIMEHDDAATIHEELFKKFASAGDKRSAKHHATLSRTHQNVW